MKNILSAVAIGGVCVSSAIMFGFSTPVIAQTRAQDVKPVATLVVSNVAVQSAASAATPMTAIPAPSKTETGAENSGLDPQSASPFATKLPARTALSTDTDTVTPEATSLPALVEAHRGAALADGETECLASAVYFESKGEPLTGQLAVAQVLLNRTSSGRFPTSLCGVVKQSHQFSFVHNGALPRARECREWHTAIAIAHIAQNQLWHPVVGKALFFHARYVSPHWHAVQVASLGNHIFYR